MAAAMKDLIGHRPIAHRTRTLASRVRHSIAAAAVADEEAHLALEVSEEERQFQQAIIRGAQQ